jgi:hypothetical protein
MNEGAGRVAHTGDLPKEDHTKAGPGAGQALDAGDARPDNFAEGLLRLKGSIPADIDLECDPAPSSRGSAPGAPQPDEAEARAAEWTRREASNLVGAQDDPVLRRFIELSARTLRWLGWNATAGFSMDPASAHSGNFAMIRHPNAPEELRREWALWADGYAALLERNPRLELERMLNTISEVVDSSSWPDGYEEDLRDWADRGQRLPWPRMLGDWAETEIDDAFYGRLRHLRAATGGWVYLDRVLLRRVFRTDEEHEADRAATAEASRRGDPAADFGAFRVGPAGELRPADPVAAAAMTVMIATGELDERGAADEVTRDLLRDPEARPEQRQAAWALRRERGLDDLSEVVGLWDHLHAWGRGTISYREVMERCRLETLEDLLAAALNSGEPFRARSREEGAKALVERIHREHLSHEDRLAATMILVRRGIGLGKATGSDDAELIACVFGEK